MIGKDFSQERANVAVCAALLHDIGHGPFSHTFEGVEKKLGTGKKHEKWTVEIVGGETEVARVLNEFNPGLRSEVGDLLGQEYPLDIYSSVVASQFDADRVDYLRRDKIMTGTEHGAFDWDWLFNNLAIEKLTIGDEDPFEIDGLILGPKGLQVAEAYLLGRFHLYTQVYMHKTTRGAEKMLEALLSRLASMISDGAGNQTGLTDRHPIQRYFTEEGNSLSNYLAIDDSTIWGSLEMLEHSDDEILSELASRIRCRNLYKCIDIEVRAEETHSNTKGRDLAP